jgi:uncharacterized phage-associated protein
MITASGIDAHVIRWAQDCGDQITNLKLQKLVYYAQAWNLAISGRRLFDGEFQAWVHGPVQPELYQMYKGYQWRPITGRPGDPSLTASAAKHMADVLEVYGPRSAYELERMTHAEAPWLEARGNLPPDHESKAVISEDTMRKYYRARISGKAR